MPSRMRSRPKVKPFALATPYQFRPAPPISLQSEEWAKGFNESRNSAVRTVRSERHSNLRLLQFWLTGTEAYYPFDEKFGNPASFRCFLNGSLWFYKHTCDAPGACVHSGHATVGHLVNVGRAVAYHGLPQFIFG